MMTTQKPKLLSERVWISPSFNNTTIYRKLRVMFHDTPNTGDTPEELAIIGSKQDIHRSGVSLPLVQVPKRFCGQYSETRFKTLPDFFKANGFFLVSERCAEVFRQFNLGSGGFVPVELYQGDRKSRIEGHYYFLNFGCRKQAFLPEQSDPDHLSAVGKLYNTGQPPSLWQATVTTKDNDCVVSKAALQGPDMWLDERVISAFFLSDRLAQALREAKVTRTIVLRRCKIVEI